jgi:DNA-binding NtrC family response regulator
MCASLHLNWGMSRLLRDRYLSVDDRQAWDLASGEVVDTSSNDESTSIDPSLAGLVEVLDHGTEGVPRWVLVDQRMASVNAVVNRAAHAAAQRGFVPIAVAMYARVRQAIENDLRDRALVLIASDAAQVADGQRALVHAAAACSRPHVLLTIRRASGMSAGIVREARAVYGARPLVRARVAAPLPADVADHLRRAARAEEFARSGRHAAAERLLREVAASLNRRGAIAQAAQASLRLGQLLLERGRAVDADRVFDDVSKVVDRSVDQQVLWHARLWQAAARIDQAQFTSAEAICRAVLAIETTPEVRERAKTVLARVLLWQARVEEAAEVEWRDGDAGGDGWTYGVAMRVRVLVRSGRLFEAGSQARELLSHADASASPIARVMASMAHLHLVAETGDLVAAEACLRHVREWARKAHTPLRFVRAQLLWADVLHRAGRHHEAARLVSRLGRVARAAPPLLRRAIERRARGEYEQRPVVVGHGPTHDEHVAATLIRLVHDQDEDGRAVQQVVRWLAERLRASRVDVCSADAGPVSTLVSVGSGLATRLGQRVLEAGIAIGPEPDDSAEEIGVPLRSRTRLVAALLARWPVDRARPAEARVIMEIAAAVIAIRVDGILTAAREVARASTTVPELVGASDALATVRKAAARAAASPFAVLIEGESGVGKELVARAVHQLSPRRERRFCDINCAALPDDLFESELFGHARGAFTGAVVDRPGLFEEADGGTLFLDELADLSPRAQAKLLRVIQQQEVRRIGESFSRKVDVRLVTAANRDMRVEAEQGRFRQDLLYRMDVIHIRIPSLRERPEDIAVLADHFWRVAAARVGTHATLTHGVMSALASYHWPGNVRELQNVMAALAVAAPTRGQLRPSLLPATIARAAASTSPRFVEARTAFERRFIEMALARAGGSRARAAREIGISRQGLIKLMARLGIAAPSSGANRSR